MNEPIKKIPVPNCFGCGNGDEIQCNGCLVINECIDSAFVANGWSLK